MENDNKYSALCSDCAAHLFDMSDTNSVRPAQMPIARDRLLVITNNGKPLVNEKWVIVKRDDHILIYDRQSGYCIYDAKLLMLETNESENDLVAVVSEIRINQDTSQRPKELTEDDFCIVSDLITGKCREEE